MYLILTVQYMTVIAQRTFSSTALSITPKQEEKFFLFYKQRNVWYDKKNSMEGILWMPMAAPGCF